MTQNRVYIFDPSGLNLGCFVFGSPFATLDSGVPPFGGPCSFDITGINEGAFLLTTNGGLPSTPGIYARSFIGIFETPASSEVIGGPPSLVGPGIDTGTMSLDVSLTSTPEPASLFLMAIAAVLCAVFRKRLRIPAPA
jgi:hypothetical protein